MVHRLALLSTSRASDAGFLASADLDALARCLKAEYRLIGGNAVTLLTHVHGVNERVPARETADADFGSVREVIASSELPAALAERGYKRVEGNRFIRSVQHGGDSLDLVVDVLAPSLQGRLVTNQEYGDLFVDEVPGLQLALGRDPVEVEFQAQLTSGETLETTALLPDVTSALVLKAYSFKGRMAARDALDVWRLLEAAQASGLQAASWPKSASGRDAARILHQYFLSPAGPGVKAASDDRRTQARIRALVAKVVAPAT